MHSRQDAAPNIDAYIAGFPPEIRARLESIRAAIRMAAPEAEETISYRMPTFALLGPLVHFAAFTKHIGFYPGAAAIAQFTGEFASYTTRKGTVHFPMDAPIPLDLIQRVVAVRVAENRAAQKVRARTSMHAPTRETV